ncbi:hypothetical protein NQ317_004932 [Molorchus minor]|uniref:RNase H type-1 domain-containing protein n=1 Tax=Molorchus minor TaxID=1323400 RepID=A0ABQ9JVM7_9CUCU|nr:hypothetical protein NQ317_004932 [Molorchus minor]
MKNQKKVWSKFVYTGCLNIPYRTHATEIDVLPYEDNTQFQAEVYAILHCAKENTTRAYVNRRINIFSDSQAALKALTNPKVTSRLVWECQKELENLADHNRVTLLWEPGHSKIQGNEKADELARKGSSTPFIGPEPALGVSKPARLQETDKSSRGSPDRTLCPERTPTLNGAVQRWPKMQILQSGNRDGSTCTVLLRNLGSQKTGYYMDNPNLVQKTTSLNQQGNYTNW